MKLNEKQRKFVEDHRDLLDSNRWEDLGSVYSDLDSTFPRGRLENCSLKFWIAYLTNGAKSFKLDIKNKGKSRSFGDKFNIRLYVEYGTESSGSDSTLMEFRGHLNPLKLKELLSDTLLKTLKNFSGDLKVATEVKEYLDQSTDWSKAMR